MDLSHWQGAPRPKRTVLEGRYARLEPLDPTRHASSLLAAARASAADDRFRYLSEEPPVDLATLTPWLEQASTSPHSLFFAVIDRETGKAEGRQALTRIEPLHGVIEIGSIFWGLAIARTRVATEAFYLMASEVFDRLGYRRLEWQSDNSNDASKHAAERFGFTLEGVFRQHRVIKGRNRDTAWYAIIDSEWPQLKASYEAWLHPDNFDENQRQINRLGCQPSTSA